jgi:opacity protein-like surface antigen
MKNTLLAIALATGGLVAATSSHAADNNGAGGFFVNGNVGQSSLDKGAYNDDDTAWGGNIGYRWAINPNVALGIEGGYNDLGKFSPKDGLGIVGPAKINGWNLGVNGHFNLTPNWYLSGRGGFYRADLKGGYVLPSGGAQLVDETTDKYYAGAGFGYDFSNNLSVGLNYDYYKADKNALKFDPTVVSLSAELRF